MKLYNQRKYPNPPYAKLGFGQTTIASHGCKLTSFSMITEIDPPTLNEQFKKDGAFIKDLLIDSKIALSLGFEYEGIQTHHPGKISVAEVDMSPSPGKQQHFVVSLANGNILDPWTGTERPGSTYPILNYRVFNFNNNTMELTKDQKKDLAKLGFDFGDNLNSGELDRLIKKALDLQNTPTPPSENCDVYKQQIVEKDARIAELEPKADIGNRFMEVSKMAVQ